MDCVRSNLYLETTGKNLPLKMKYSDRSENGLSLICYMTNYIC